VISETELIGYEVDDYLLTNPDNTSPCVGGTDAVPIEK
jgi:hypothetical protein